LEFGFHQIHLKDLSLQLLQTAADSNLRPVSENDRHGSGHRKTSIVTDPPSGLSLCFVTFARLPGHSCRVEVQKGIHAKELADTGSLAVTRRFDVVLEQHLLGRPIASSASATIP
jgi:hypothetical protein